jgi:hypothetical protein
MKRLTCQVGELRCLRGDILVGLRLMHQFSYLEKGNCAHELPTFTKKI